jgi:hypothetical protein
MIVILSERSESKDLRLLFELDLKGHDFSRAAKWPNTAWGFRP